MLETSFYQVNFGTHTVAFHISNAKWDGSDSYQKASCNEVLPEVLIGRQFPFLRYNIFMSVWAWESSSWQCHMNIHMT